MAPPSVSDRPCGRSGCCFSTRRKWAGATGGTFGETVKTNYYVKYTESCDDNDDILKAIPASISELVLTVGGEQFAYTLKLDRSTKRVSGLQRAEARGESSNCLTDSLRAYFNNAH